MSTVKVMAVPVTFSTAPVNSQTLFAKFGWPSQGGRGVDVWNQACLVLYGLEKRGHENRISDFVCRGGGGGGGGRTSGVTENVSPAASCITLLSYTLKCNLYICVCDIWRYINLFKDDNVIFLKLIEQMPAITWDLVAVGVDTVAALCFYWFYRQYSSEYKQIQVYTGHYKFLALDERLLWFWNSMSLWYYHVIIFLNLVCFNFFRLVAIS